MPDAIKCIKYFLEDWVDFNLIIDQSPSLKFRPQKGTFRGSEWAYMVKCPKYLRKVTQIIPGGQQEGEHGVVQGLVHGV